jgi:hypothetical protein
VVGVDECVLWLRFAQQKSSHKITSVGLSFPAGLPDGLFSNQKSKFGKILEGLAMEDVVIFYGHLVHFTVFCYILLTFGKVCGNLVHFIPFWYFVPRKI